MSDGDEWLTAVGDSISGCIQIGHYGPHEATPHCLLIDGEGRCFSPSTPPGPVRP